jgi:hypothetical protein
MDLLFRPICEFEHKVLERHGASFDDFLLYFGSPNVLDPPLVSTLRHQANPISHNLVSVLLQTVSTKSE